MRSIKKKKNQSKQGTHLRLACSQLPFSVLSCFQPYPPSAYCNLFPFFLSHPLFLSSLESHYLPYYSSHQQHGPPITSMAPAILTCCTSHLSQLLSCRNGGPPSSLNPTPGSSLKCHLASTHIYNKKAIIIKIISLEPIHLVQNRGSTVP